MTLSKKLFYFLVLGLSLFLAAFAWHAYSDESRNAFRYKKLIEKDLHALEKECETHIFDTDFINRRITKVSNGSIFKDDLARVEVLRLKPYSISVFVDSALVFWTKNDILPHKNTILDQTSGKIHVRFIKLNNARYEMRYTTYRNDKKQRISVCALIPLKQDYGNFEGIYLKNHFPASSLIPAQVKLEDSTRKTAFAIVSRENAHLCWLDNSEANADYLHDVVMAILLVLGFGFVAFFGDRLVKQNLAQGHSPFWGTILFLAFSMFLRFCIYVIQDRNFMPTTDLKMSDFQGGFIHSLSDLTLNSAFMLWFAIFFNSHFSVPTSNANNSLWKKLALGALFYTIVVALTLLCIGVFNDLVSSSANILAFESLTSFNFRGIFALICIDVILLSVFLISHKLFQSINLLNLRLIQKLFLVALSVCIGLVYESSCDLNIPWFGFIMFSTLYIVIFTYYKRLEQKTFVSLILWIAAFAFFQAVFISDFNIIKNRRDLLKNAQTLAVEQDLKAEEYIGLLTDSLEHEPMLQKFFNPDIFKIESEKVSECIRAAYESDDYLHTQYFMKHFGLAKGVANIEADSADLNQLYRKLETAKNFNPKKPNQYFWTNNKGDFSYISIANIACAGDTSQIVMEFKRYDRLASRAFTELLVDKGYKNLHALSDFNYVVYKNNQATEQNQLGSYSTRINSEELPNRGTHVYQKSDGREELILRTTNETVVRIGKEHISSYGTIMFMYIFLVMCLVLFFLALINSFVPFLPEAANLKISFSMRTSLSNRLFIPFFLFIFGSFCAIFLVTVRYFSTVDDKFNSVDLEKKNNVTVGRLIQNINVQYNLKDSTKENLIKLVSEYSTINESAIHVFDTQGMLFTTTEPDLFDKGIISSRMNPAAFMKLSSGANQAFNTDEHIGAFHFKTSFYTIFTEDNKQILGFLELPHYSRDRKLKAGSIRAWSFTGAVLIFVAVFGVMFIYFQIQRTMQPFRDIAQKITKLTIGNKVKNEPVVWKMEDEIGILVSAYNNKIREIEEQSEQIALNARESAWRDMAKQVAHEIRNSLTPMNLVVQHLDQQHRKRAENIDDLIIRTIRVMYDQMETLGKIAGEFSKFAKMPQQAANETFCLNNLLVSVSDEISVEKNSENTKVTSNIPENERFFVYADRALLTAAFNNLIRNALQAIPEDRKGRVSITLFRQNEKTVIVKISDNGTGIPEDIQSKIFTPDFTTKVYGSGIGLLITKNIIHAINGSIRFESLENIGTDFFIELNIERFESATDKISLTKPKMLIDPNLGENM
jgi:two-component system, NtrC family, nitrogen regulation sensor histidine kinase NtrY